MKTSLTDNTLTLFLEGRIDSNNAAQVEQEALSAVAQNPGAELALDAENLEYISSAGLRVLMKLRKQAKKALPVWNVSPEVYEIFDVTGFTDLLEVHKALRKVSVEGLKQIGQGATAKVYRLDRETIVKVFGPTISLDTIQRENERSRNAFISGIPTAIAYDIVRVGDGYGAIYELLDAQDLLTLMENDKKHLEAYVVKFAATMRKMHEIEVDPQCFPPAKQTSIAYLAGLKGICTQEELEKLRCLYDNIPDRNTFIHGDCHPGNVMVQNGEFMFIDLMTCGCGHPIFDLASMCISYFFSQRSPESQKTSVLLRNFTSEEIARIWNTYLCAYLGTTDESFLRKAVPQIAALTAARMLFATIAVPGLFSPEQIHNLKQTALAYVDSGLEPICF